MHYVVTAHKASAVQQSTTGHFTHTNQLNLIIAKCTRIEIHLLTPEGLQALFDLPIYGRITTMELFRPAGCQRDVLFVATERFKFCVLEYDPVSNAVITRANGDLQDRIGRETDNGQIGHVDPMARVIGMHIYDGLFKVIPIDHKGNLVEAFNIRMEELQILDIQFLHGAEVPTIVVLHQDARENRHLRTYEIDVFDKDFRPGPWLQNNVEMGGAMIIPIPSPLGGVVLIGEQTISYFHGGGGAGGGGGAAAAGGGGGGGASSNTIAIGMPLCDIQSFSLIDDNGSRILLGDVLSSSLFVLVLENDGNRVLGLSLQKLGKTTTASSLSYLDNGVVFVGSSFGDSQLVRLQADAVDDANNNNNSDAVTYVEVLENFASLAPISDFVVVDIEKQGQGMVVACCGAFQSGSLRIVRNGIGINEQAAVDIEGIRGMWALKRHFGAEFDSFLVQSFVSETRILEMRGEELEETEFDGFDAAAQTLYCANTVHDNLVQVTSSTISTVSSTTKAVISQWKPQGGAKITLVAGNSTHLVVALGGGKVVLLEMTAGGVNEIRSTILDVEVACLNLPSTSPSSSDPPPPLIVCGMWDMSVVFLHLHDLSIAAREPLHADIVPRSVLLVRLESSFHLLVGLGDGCLAAYNVDFALVPPSSSSSNQENNPPLGTTLSVGAGLSAAVIPSLRNRKRVSLGTQPITLSLFPSKGHIHVFAACDRPAVIYSSNGKLLFSNVDLKDVTHMASFNGEEFPESLALSTETMLTIGTIDEIQKLHIRTVPLGEQPRRICHHEPSRAFCVATMEQQMVGEEEVETYHLRLFDDQTFDKLDTFTLDQYENCLAVLTCVFDGDAATYVIAGTAFAFPSEPEPKEGRILVFDVSDRHLSLVAERKVTGGVYCLSAFHGKLLAGINSKLQLLAWVATDGNNNEHELQAECGVHGSTIVYSMQTRGNFVLVGDLIRSMWLLTYKPADNVFEEVARDLNANWMTALDMLDDDVYLGAENHFNLFTCRRNAAAAVDDERRRLDVTGRFHLGELVNRFRTGSLVLNINDSQQDVTMSNAAPLDASSTTGGGGAAAAAASGDNNNNNNNNNATTTSSSSSSSSAVPTLLFGTVSGALGVIATLNDSDFALLSELQTALTTVVRGIGGLSHGEWRSFANELGTASAHGFVDGDLIETFLDLKREKMDEVAARVGRSVEELTRRVEELQRLH